MFPLTNLAATLAIKHREKLKKLGYQVFGEDSFVPSWFQPEKKKEEEKPKEEAAKKPTEAEPFEMPNPEKPRGDIPELFAKTPSEFRVGDTIESVHNADQFKVMGSSGLNDIGKLFNIKTGEAKDFNFKDSKHFKSADVGIGKPKMLEGGEPFDMPAPEKPRGAVGIGESDDIGDIGARMAEERELKIAAEKPHKFIVEKSKSRINEINNEIKKAQTLPQFIGGILNKKRAVKITELQTERDKLEIATREAERKVEGESFFGGFFREMGEQFVGRGTIGDVKYLENVPFFRDLTESVRSQEEKALVKKSMSRETLGDIDRANLLLISADRLEGDGMGAMSGEMLSGLLPDAAEFATTWSLFGAPTKAATTKKLSTLLGKGKWGNRIASVLGFTAGAGVKTVADFPQIATSEKRREIPQWVIGESELGEIEAVMTKDADPELKRWTKSIMTQGAENLTEFAGGLLGVAGKPAKKIFNKYISKFLDTPQFLKNIKLGIINETLEKYGIKRKEDAKKMLSGFGIHKPLTEVFEEELNVPVQHWIEEDPNPVAWAWTPEGAKRVAVELLTMGLFGIGMSAASNRFGQKNLTAEDISKTLEKDFGIPKEKADILSIAVVRIGEQRPVGLRGLEGEPEGAPRKPEELEAREVAPEEIAETEKRVEATEGKRAAEEKILKPVEAGEVPTMAQKEMFPDTTAGQADIFTEGAKMEEAPVEEVPMPEGFEDFDREAYEAKALAEVEAEMGENPFSELAKGVAAEMNKSGSKDIDGMDLDSVVHFLKETGRAPKLLETLKDLDSVVDELQHETNQDISTDEVFSEATGMFKLKRTYPKHRAPSGTAKLRAQMEAARAPAAPAAPAAAKPKTTAEKIKALPLDKRSKAEKKIAEYERAIKQAQKTGVFPTRARAKLDVLPEVKIPKGKAVERVASEEAGVKVPAKKIVITEKAALKERISALKRGATFAERATKTEIAEVQTKLTKIIKDSPLDPKDKAKFLPTIKHIRTREQLDKWLPEVEARIDEMFEASSRKKLNTQIKNELAKHKVKKGERGKTTVEYEMLRSAYKEIFYDGAKLRTQAENELLLEDVEQRLAQNTTESPVVFSDFVLHALLTESTKGLGEMSVAEMDTTLTRIQQTREIARDSFLWKQAERAAKLAEETELSVENMRSPRDEFLEDVMEHKKRTRTFIGDVVKKLDIWDRGYAQIINLLDSIRGGRFYKTLLYRPISDANKEYFVREDMHKESDRKFLEKTFGKKWHFLDHAIKKLDKPLDLGVFTDGAGNKHRINSFPLSVLGEIYNHNKMEANREVMYNSGIYVGGKNPKTRVLYMTDEIMNAVKDRVESNKGMKAITEYTLSEIGKKELNDRIDNSYEEKWNKPLLRVKGGYLNMSRRHTSDAKKSMADPFHTDQEGRGLPSPKQFEERVKSDAPLIVGNIWHKYLSYIDAMERFIAYDKALTNIKSVITSPDFKSEVRELYGDEGYKELMDSFNWTAVGGWSTGEMRSGFDTGIQYVVSALSVSFVGSRPTRNILTQGSSACAAFADVPIKDFVKGLTNTIVNPAKAYDKMMESPLIRYRHKRADFTRGMFIAGSSRFKKQGVSPSQVAMYPVKVGDMIGAIGAGHSIYQYKFEQYKKEMDEVSADREALRDAEDFVVATQQSSLPEFANRIKRSDPLMRSMGTFQQSQQQYRARGFEAINTWLESKDRWAAENFNPMAKKVIAYHFIVPAMFEISRGNINPASIGIKTVLSPISGFMGWGKYVEWAIVAAIMGILVSGEDKKKWKAVLPFVPAVLIGEGVKLADKTFKAVGKMIRPDGKKIKGDDIIDFLNGVAAATKFPSPKNLREEYLKYSDVLSGESSAFRLLQTEWQAEQAGKKKPKKKSWKSMPR